MTSDPYQVFLSYSLANTPNSATVRETLEHAGLRVFDPPRDLIPGDEMDTQLHHAIAGSGAVVFVAPQGGDVSANALLELGAAWGANKDVYVVSPPHSPMTHVPLFVRRNPIFPINRLDDLVFQIKREAFMSGSAVE
jgi:hypothetical protein